MKKEILILMIVGIIVIFWALWDWQARYADDLLRIEIPNFIVGDENTKYFIAIHKSQIRPYFTVWKQKYEKNP